MRLATLVVSAVGLFALGLYGTVLPIILAAVAAGLVRVAQQRGWLVAIPTVGLFGALLLMVAANGASLARIPLHFSTTACAAAILAWATVALLREPMPRLASRPVIGVFLVPAVWIVLAVVSFVVPGASPRSWAMLGDSANNLLFARDVVAERGVSFAGDNPAPFPHVVVASFLSRNPDHHTASGLVAHDITTYVSVWHAVVVANIVLLGALTWAFAQRVQRAGASAVVGAILAGLVPFTWIYSGYAMGMGFFNTHVSLALVLAALLLSVLRTRAPLVVLGGQFAASAMLLLTWPPLAVVPLALAALGVREAIRTARRQGAERVTIGVVVAAGVAWLAYGLALGVSLLRQGSGVASTAGGILPPPLWALPLMAVAAVIVATITLGWHHRVEPLMTVGALSLACVVMLAMARGWSYYPQKLAWFAIVICSALVVVMCGAGVIRLFDRVRGGWGLAVAAVTLVGLGAVPQLAALVSIDVPWAAGPWQAILKGDPYPADQLYITVVELTDDEAVHLLWRSELLSEPDANFWIMNLYSAMHAPASQERFMLRARAYEFYNPTPELPCAVAAAVGVPTVLHSIPDAAMSSAETSCTDGPQVAVARDALGRFGGATHP